jgi:hypothetical protein
VANRGTDTEVGASQGQAPMGRRMPLSDDISAPPLQRRRRHVGAHAAPAVARAGPVPPRGSRGHGHRHGRRRRTLPFRQHPRYAPVLFLWAGRSRCRRESRVPCAQAGVGGHRGAERLGLFVGSGSVAVATSRCVGEEGPRVRSRPEPLTADRGGSIVAGAFNDCLSVSCFLCLFPGRGKFGTTLRDALVRQRTMGIFVNSFCAGDRALADDESCIVTQDRSCPSPRSPTTPLRL